jgi:hypothetical protein
VSEKKGMNHFHQPKRLFLIGGSACAGIGFFLYRRYYENGELTKIDLFATVTSVVMITIILIVIGRIASRKD